MSPDQLHVKLKRLKGEWTPMRAIFASKYPYSRQAFYGVLTILLQEKKIKKVCRGHYLTLDKL